MKKRPSKAASGRAVSTIRSIRGDQAERLAATGRLTPRELARDEPEVFAEIEARFVAARRAAAVAALGDVPPPLLEAIENTDLPALSQPETTFADEILRALVGAKVPKKLMAQAEERLRAAESAGSLRDPSASDMPLRDNPVSRPAVLEAGVAAVLESAGIGAGAAGTAVARIGSVDAFTRPALDALVADRTLGASDADRIEAAAVVFQLTSGGAAAGRAVLGLGADRPEGARVGRAADLATLEIDDWRGVIQGSGLPVPEGLDADGYARVLTERVARLLPTDFLLHRATAAPKDLQALVKTAAARTDGARPEALERLVRRNPGLSIPSLLAAGDGVAVTSREIERRLQLVADTWSRNPGRNLLALDYSPESADLDAIAVSPLADENDHQMVLANLRAHQRMFVVGGDAPTALALLDLGHYAARHVVAHPVAEFVRTSTLPVARALAVYRRAEARATAAAVKGMAIVHAGRPTGKTPATVTPPDTTQYLSKIPGYTALFESLGFCDCEECQSVLGLSAYFVDLMYFVEKHILDLPENFKSQPAHPLHLNTRRHDLWTLNLTCRNASEVVAYLDIINEVLETYLASKAPAGAGDIWERIAARNLSFSLPFDWPNARIETYLRYFGRRRVDAMRACGATAADVARARLGLSSVEYAMVVQPLAANLAQPTVAEQSAFITLYDFILEVAGNGTVSASGLSLVFVHDMLKATGVTRSQLTDLLATTFISGGDTLRPRAGRSQAASVQNDVEIIEGLAARHLDRFHRFVRLSRRLPWSVAELDLVLARLQASGLATGLDGPALAQISALLALQERLGGLAVQELTGVWSEIPNVASDGRPGLFDTLFNPPQLAALGSPIAYAETTTTTFLHPSWNTAAGAPGTSSPRDNTLARLLTGLRVSDRELVELLTHLAVPLGIRLTGTAAQHAFALSVGNLSLLYRHATLARAFGLSIKQLFQLIETSNVSADLLAPPPVPLAPPAVPAAIHVIDTLAALVDAHDWTSASGFDGDEIAFVTGRTPLDTKALPDADAIATTAVRQLLADRAFEFADTILSGLPNGTASLTESQSRAILAQNAALFEPAPDGSRLRLKASVLPAPAPAAILLPADPAITLSPAIVAARLARFSIRQLLPVALSNALGIAPEKTDALCRLANQAATLDSAAFLQAMAGLLYSGGTDQSALVALLDGVLPLTVLYRDDVFDVATLDFIGQTPKTRAAFGVSGSPDTESVRLSARYRRLARRPDPAYATTAQAPDTRALRAVLDTAGGVLSASTVDVALALRTDRARIDALLPHLTAQLGTVPATLDQLGQVAECLDLMTLLGTSGETLTDLALPSTATPPEPEFQRLRRAADGLFAACHLKHATDEDFRAKIEPYEDSLRSLRRDGLVAYLRFTDPARFRKADDLYPYFLLDVRLEGCARTTRLAAAVFSLQLYVHRVLLHLERSDDPDFVVSSRHIPRTEWSWLRHYRLWQANRKVFLYPENYLEPDLRDDKTPLFAELEDTLLQQAITEQNVRDGYARYLSGFTEVSGLRIAAACSQIYQPDPDTTSDILHLFGVTAADPPQYYYRAIENIQHATSVRQIQFGAWRRLELQIPVTTCAAIVHLGVLYIFWAEIVTQPKTLLVAGASVFRGYTHKVALKFSSLRLDGHWTPPQVIRVPGGSGLTDRVTVDDPLRQALNPNGSVKPHKFLKGEPCPIDFPPVPGGVPPPPLIFKRGDPLPFDLNFVVPLVPTLDPAAQEHVEPHDDYTLKGFRWVTPYPAVSGGNFVLTYGDSLYTIDLLNGVAVTVERNWEVSAVFSSQSGQLPALALLTGPQGTPRGLAETNAYGLWSRNPYFSSAQLLLEGFADTQALLITPGAAPLEPTPIEGVREGAVVRAAGDSFYVGSGTTPPFACRLNSSIAPALAQTLFTGKLETLLSVETQLGPKALAERAVGFSMPGAGALLPTTLDFAGAAAPYYSEIFAHIPWRIADHLRADGQFDNARRWYDFIFDPAGENVPPVNPLSRRVWQYSKFRTEPLASLREALDNTAALDVYRGDPFSPHAIARLRPGAYEKAMVMQYVGNLVDWGDSLFSQFTSESINEATMLYMLASDILGPRPDDVGECGEVEGTDQSPKTYGTIAPLLRASHEFILELENLWIATLVPVGVPAERLVPAAATIASTSSAATAAFGGGVAGAGGDAYGLSRPYGWSRQPPALWSASRGTPVSALQLGQRVGEGPSPLPLAPGGRSFGITPDPLGPPETPPPAIGGGLLPGGFVPQSIDVQPGLPQAGVPTRPIDDGPVVHAEPWHLLDTSLAFCIPPNDELLALWDRVALRLYQIRHCMDINGVHRLPDLFGPPIDPHLLVKMQAEGLTPDDVLRVTSGSVPPYRFPLLLEKARQYAGTVQAFGSALLGALEKRDTEALTQLRTVHEQHLLKMRLQVQQFEVTSAQQTLAGLQLQQQAAQYRREYYAGLSRTGLLPWEITQQVSTHIANASVEAASVLQLVGGGLALLPQIGAPTAMKYGGQETSHASWYFAGAARMLGELAELVGKSAGIEAGFQRRDAEWRHQAELAQRDVDQLGRQIAAATFRVQIAERNLVAHDESIAQVEEIFQFYQDRFTSLGLYKQLARTLQTLYRTAFNSAQSMAMMADQAYRFERPDDAEPHLNGSYWDAGTGGLLAGERLLLDLQGLERKYLESDRRHLEMEQSYSLAQFDPAALLALRETGECSITIPELFFDLSYPGHYRRRIKAVRLSIPCIVGAFANASATLRLLDSDIRMDASSTRTTPVAARHEVSIAASSGQNDAGVFEFSFRDERYMPFEGNGAASRWKLTLPKAFRMFDYATISDVILRISYTALSDETLRASVEGELTDLSAALTTRLAATEMQSLISLRQDMPDAFARLTRETIGTAVPFTVDRRRLPWFLATRPITISSVRVLVRTPARDDAPTLTLAVDGAPVGAFDMDGRGARPADTWSLFTSDDLSADVEDWFAGPHTVTLTDVGDLHMKPPAATSLDPAKLLDVLFDVRYTLATHA